MIIKLKCFKLEIMQIIRIDVFPNVFYDLTVRIITLNWFRLAPYASIVKDKSYHHKQENRETLYYKVIVVQDDKCCDWCLKKWLDIRCYS